MNEASEKFEPLAGWEFGKVLADAGVIGQDVSRVVIDVPANGVVKLYVERYGSRKLLRVVSTLEGARIKTVDAEKLPA